MLGWAKKTFNSKENIKNCKNNLLRFKVGV